MWDTRKSLLAIPAVKYYSYQWCYMLLVVSCVLLWALYSFYILHVCIIENSCMQISVHYLILWWINGRLWRGLKRWSINLELLNNLHNPQLIISSSLITPQISQLFFSIFFPRSIERSASSAKPETQIHL